MGTYHAKHWASFPYIILFSPHSNPLRKPPHFYAMIQGENRGAEETSTILKVTQLVTELVIKSRFIWLQPSLHLNRMPHYLPSVKNASLLVSNLRSCCCHGIHWKAHVLHSLDYFPLWSWTGKIQLFIVSIGRNFKMCLQSLWHLSLQKAEANFPLPSRMWARFRYLLLMKNIWWK